jgi:hypothetical protein
VNKKKHQIQAIWLLTKKKRKFVSRWTTGRSSYFNK